MNFEFTTDRTFVKQCLTSPRVWRMGSEDGMPAKEFFYLPTVTSLKYVRAEDKGVFILDKRSLVSHEVHVALLPGAYGKAVDICREAVEWTYDTLPMLQGLVANIPSYNLLAIRLAEKIGFKLIGSNPKSFLKNGKLHDTHIYQFSKEYLTCHQ